MRNKSFSRHLSNGLEKSFADVTGTHVMGPMHEQIIAREKLLLPMVRECILKCPEKNNGKETDNEGQ